MKKLNRYICKKSIVVTYSQFDSNIHVFYVFLGYLKNTWKYLIQRPIFKPLYFYNAFFKILENTSFWAPSKNTHISYVTTMKKSQIIFFWGGNDERLCKTAFMGWFHITCRVSNFYSLLCTTLSTCLQIPKFKVLYIWLFLLYIPTPKLD